jgi:purine-binding chemotaxis protein CheW
MAVITHLPKQPDYGRRVLDLRNAKMLLIDLCCRLSHGLTRATPMHVVIIVQMEARLVGQLCNWVSDIVPVDTAKIQGEIEQRPTG